MKKKLKAVTFSFDDGNRQNKRLVDIFNKYGLKCSFNFNSGYLSVPWEIQRDGVKFNADHLTEEQVKEYFAGHEISSHTIHHPRLTGLADEDVVREVEGDRQRLSEIVGYQVQGFAYPGSINAFDDRVINIIKNKTGVRFARTVTGTHSFDLPEDLFLFNPTVHLYGEYERAVEMAKSFIEMKPDKPQLYSIWGHSYEFELGDGWEKFEAFCRLLSGKEDIFYGTNSEVLLSDQWYK